MPRCFTSLRHGTDPQLACHWSSPAKSRRFLRQTTLSGLVETSLMLPVLSHPIDVIFYLVGSVSLSFLKFLHSTVRANKLVKNVLTYSDWCTFPNKARFICNLAVLKVWISLGYILIRWRRLFCEPHALPAELGCFVIIELVLIHLNWKGRLGLLVSRLRES